MRRLLQLFARFGRDEGGQFLAIFAALAIVLVATSGAVVDYTAIEQARTRAQVALDTASLGLQPRIYDQTPAQLTTAAQNLLLQQLSTNAGAPWSLCGTQAVPPCADIDVLTEDEAEGTIHIEAIIKVPTSFVSLIGFTDFTARIVSEATRKKLNLEVVMVLDNSGSMSGTRMTRLKEAARCATNILFGNECTANSALATTDDVRIGIVPFTEFVNVGTGYANASWLDRAGRSRVARDNFDDDSNDQTPFNGPVDRLELYRNLRGVSWMGCVEARLPPYDTNDTEPQYSNPDTLFAPAFAPDEPDSAFYNSYIPDDPSNCPRPPQWVRTESKTRCIWSASSESGWNSASCSGASSTEVRQTDQNGVVTYPSGTTEPAEIYDNPATCSTSVSSSGYFFNYTITRTRTCNYYYSQRELQERICKYADATVNTRRDGPNYDCPAASILPLTYGKDDADGINDPDKSDVIAKINSMVALGGTNIHQGAIWGYHMLSPTEPLTEAKPYGGANSKVMIIMTDGENTHSYVNNMNKASWYVAYGYPYNGRLDGNSTNALQLEMNARTLATCADAKAMKDKEPGIIIYTIGLNPPNQATRTLLTNCASEPSKAFFPTDANQLVDDFRAIANQLSNLRLAR